ncbi:DUF6199 family natural product biosynthesis protein [Eubacterium barkeri]|uniref:DUF6199 domain-containing protein n=1 Tax=Eubacterium barkeri TaxID=1528 RepID=A0A1H3FSV7_EUBBA|nr:DUF6199 family natural product biosynthesis protein [Eubacterium barkeri]SDX93468.1 hypothetical protein SAMN04488579_11156 [Eubacterium barkeri]
MTQEQIAGILMILIALVILILPKQIWKVVESWKNKEQVAPSDAYILVVRCVALVFLIVGIVVML